MFENEGVITMPFFKNGLASSQFEETGEVSDSLALEHVYYKTIGGDDGGVAHKTSDTARFFINLSDFINDPNSGLNSESPLFMFNKPVLISDFSIDPDARKYSSQLVSYNKSEFIDGEKIKFPKHLEELFYSLYQFDHDHSISDSIVNDHFEVEVRGGISPKKGFPEDGKNAALNKFLSVLSYHMSQMLKVNEGADYSSSEDGSALNKKYPLDSFARSTLINLQKLMENGGESSTNKRNLLDVYPFFGTRSQSDYLLAISVSHLDPIFVDDKVENEHRLPIITLVVFDVSQPIRQAGEGQIDWLNSYLRYLLCSLSHTVIAEKRREAIETAAGEAAEISRYWNSQGLLNLMQEDEQNGLFQEEDRFDFWSRFVEELLCAKIPGVKTVETFPFDRAILIGETGDQEKSGVHELKVKILETALRCTESEYLNEFYTSRESALLGLKLDSFDVTDKKISLEYEVSISSPKEKEFRFNSSPEAYPMITQIVDTDGDAAKVDRHVRAILGVLEPDLVPHEKKQDFKKSQDNWRKSIGEYFNEEGISYSYCHGIDKEEDIPNLSIIDSYLGEAEEGLSSLIRNIKDSPEGSEESSDSFYTGSKVVFVSFEPLRHSKNKETGMPLGDDERISLILIADEDPPKSTQEVDAERKDLELLFTTVIRQKYRDAERKKFAFSKQSEVIRSSLGQFSHNLKDASAEARTAVKQQVNAIESMLNALEGKKPDPEEYTDAKDILEAFSYGIQEGGERVSLERYAASIVEKIIGIPNERIPKVTTTLSTIPRCKLSLPEGVVDEVFRVMFKNAVEAASASKVKHPDVSVHISIRPEPSQSKYSLEILIENSSKPVPKNVLDTLNNPEPKAFENYKNPEKEESTGVGVYIARVMLRYGVGKGSDLNFFMLTPERFQTRMSIPCEVVPIVHEETHEESSSEKVQDHDSKYILYIEDRDDYGIPSSEFLASSLSGKECMVQWERALEESTKALQTRLPELLITDMNFSKSNKELSKVSDKHGRKLLKAFFAQVVNSDHKPPVWIVTNEEKGPLIRELQNKIPEFKASKYVVGDGEAPLTESGSIHVLSSVKDLSKSELVKDAINTFGNELSAIKSGVEILQSISDNVNDQEAPYHEEVLSKNFSNLNKILSQYFSERDSEYRSSHTFVLQANVGSLDGLGKVIRLWHASEGIPDPDFDEDGPVNLTSPDHKNMLLKIVTNPDVAKQLQPKFYYWCFQNNIVVVTSNIKTSDLALSWSRFMTTDVFSSLRHDLKGLRGVDEAERDDLIEQVTVRETFLKLTDNEMNQVNSYFLGEDELSNCNFLINDDASFNETSFVTDRLKELSDIIIQYSGTLKHDAQKEDMRLFAERLYEMRHILSGGDLNE